ncbi:methyltransferase domain-containing protein [Kribbella sp. NPDC051770]|uniref:class I SAM-dependent methyltransferase n=1 Tax=Kribbella sp. NPDC051770 TaxID=3155413 RepID=UPI0034194714
MLTWEEAQSFNRLAERYDRLAELTDDPVGVWLPSVLGDVRRTANALELGCGAGRHSVLLAERFDRVDAYDLSGAMIRLARGKRARSNIFYLESDLCDVDGRYDLVLSVATLHHVTDLEGALSRIRAATSPGGRVVLVDTVSPRAANPRWRLYGNEVRKLLRNLVRRDAREAWEIFRLSTGPWLDHRVSDRYLSREQFEKLYAEAFPDATFTRVGNAHAMIWDAT